MEYSVTFVLKSAETMS